MDVVVFFFLSSLLTVANDDSGILSVGPIAAIFPRQYTVASGRISSGDLENQSELVSRRR